MYLQQGIGRYDSGIGRLIRLQCYYFLTIVHKFCRMRLPCERRDVLKVQVLLLVSALSAHEDNPAFLVAGPGAKEVNALEV